MRTRLNLRATIPFAMLLLVGGTVASAQSLGSAGSFGLVGGTTVTAGGASSVVNGDVGVSPGTSITGFPSPAATTPPYSVHSNDAAAIAAQASTLSLYNTLATTGGATAIAAQLSATTRGPGVYSIGAADLAAGGTFTLDGAGTYIFQVSSSLTANVNSQVLLQNGANACNVFWQVTSAATLNGLNFPGNVVAQANVTLGVGMNLTGRALATSLGSITMAGGNTVGGCSSAAVAPAPTPIPPPGPPAPTPRPNACAATAPDLFPVKRHTGTFVVGTNASYTISVFNNGVTAVGATAVTDTLPAGLSFVSASGTSWSCAATGAIVTCTTTAATPGNITLTVTPTASAVPSVTNRAVVTGGGDCDVTNNEALDVTAVAVAVPTLPEWAFLLLAVVLAAGGAVMLRRRSTTV
jgi:uncharacterized repeat protein (TIGR01451 family)